MFTSTLGRGVHFTFPHVTVSIQWGTGNYCSKRDSYVAKIDAPSNMWASRDAEVAVWRTSDKLWVTGYPHANENDDVVGWLSIDKVMDILEWARRLEAEPPVRVSSYLSDDGE